MTPSGGLLLALSSLPEWSAWAALGLVLLSSVLWSKRRVDDGDEADSAGPGDPPSVDLPPRDDVDLPPRDDLVARLRELEQTIDELTRSRAVALEAADRRDEFLNAISHELRSPLNAILGWTRVLEPRSDLPADVGDALRVIRRNALRQCQLLDDFVDMSRVVSGALHIEPRPMRIQDAIDEACQAIHPEMERKGINLDCAPITATVSGDPRRLQQVLRNLLTNAIRFTPPGGMVSVRASRSESEVTIAISDTGVGIEPAFLPHVFEPFRQQPGTMPRDQATFGLGLALARMVVVGHGGRVAAFSDGPGRGSTFTVTLPALETEARGSGSHEAARPAVATPLAGVRVLAVDDEPDWRELLGHILGAAGADARIAASAAEAIQVFEEWRPDVVLTDIAMPGVDGYGLLAAIRGRGGAGRAIPAIAMTAHAGTPDRTRTARAGFAEHLAKPISPHELIDAVRRVSEQAGLAKGAGPV